MSRPLADLARGARPAQRVAVVAAVFLALQSAAWAAAAVIGSEARLPDDPREYYARFVTFRPPDGAVVKLNPPRFCWPYVPEIFPEKGKYPAQQRFALQVSRTADFAQPEIVVRDTPFNFYNTLPPLSAPGRWFWRVGYNVGTPRERWSAVRSFVIASDAVVWDRSALAEPGKFLRGHPRLCFNRDNWERIKALKDNDPESAEIFRSAIAFADRALLKPWWKNFPRDDSRPMSYMAMGRDMAYVAFAYRFTRDPKYAGVLERAVQMAAWPKGGYASPEGAGAEDKWETHLTEYLALILDWLWDDFTEAQRKTLINSLSWRIEHTINSFAWHRSGGRRMSLGSVATLCYSHPFENLMVTIPGCIAIYEHSAAARLGLNLGINYLIGVTNGFGRDGGWNEGPGYGNGKMKWLMDAVLYCNFAFPQLHLEKNPLLAELGDFFCRITPVGMQHSSFGNRAYHFRDWTAGRMCNMRRLAFLLNDGRFLANYENSARLLGSRYRSSFTFHHWQEYVLPYYYRRPKPELEKQLVKVYKTCGWVTATTRPPSSLDAYPQAVGITFHCRPAGGYSHSFWSEGAFDIFAYGQVIAHGGGSTNNGDRHANDTMSHNTILVDGHGQYQDILCGRRKRAGYISAFAQGKNFVYWAGDATNAYQTVPYLRRFVRHVLFVRGRYFVIFDDLETEPGHPARFTWLYHFAPAAKVSFDSARFRISYAIGKTRVTLAHICRPEDLQFEDRQGVDGLRNPLTGRDFLTRWREYGRGVLFAHNFWITNRTPATQRQFLAVIYPYRSGAPAPQITRINDHTVRVEDGERVDVLTFDRQFAGEADIFVDFRALR